MPKCRACASVISPGRGYRSSPDRGCASASIRPARRARSARAVAAVPDRPRQDTRGAAPSCGRPDAPFVLRLNRFFWSAAAGRGRAVPAPHARATRATATWSSSSSATTRAPEQEGEHRRLGAASSARVVRRFGRIRRVVALQVTNEVNFLTISPDSSDGAYDGRPRRARPGRDRRQGRGRAAARLPASSTVGFNWAYRNRSRTARRTSGSYLRDHGGRRFRRAVDWVGLDAYPGTVFPPLEPPGGERDGMVTAMSRCATASCRSPGSAGDVPIHVEENGWPTGPGRSEAEPGDGAERDGRRGQRLPRHLQRQRLPLVRPARPRHRRRRTSSTTTACCETTTRRSRPSPPTATWSGSWASAPRRRRAPAGGTPRPAR